MEAITEQYKTMSAENGVFGILFPTYVKHDFQVGNLFSAIIVHSWDWPQEHSLSPRPYEHWIGTTTTTEAPTTEALDELTDEEKLKVETKKLNDESQDIVM